ncbi:MAG: hypothetical protein K5633_04695, partial [Paludibacteraceae bacterium]|nr:hypothetical protein [Paludibacteraceae bacterium]
SLVVSKRNPVHVFPKQNQNPTTYHPHMANYELFAPDHKMATQEAKTKQTICPFSYTSPY